MKKNRKKSGLAHCTRTSHGRATSRKTAIPAGEMSRGRNRHFPAASIQKNRMAKGNTTPISPLVRKASADAR